MEFSLICTSRFINLLLIFLVFLNQRASQLRNTPFSGESTDSSDNESSAGDYCTPPDELAATEETDLQVKERTDKVLEGTTQVLKTCATYTTVSLKKVNTAVGLYCVEKKVYECSRQNFNYVGLAIFWLACWMSDQSTSLGQDCWVSFCARVF